MDKKEKGEHVNERDLKKHKLDVFRLLQIVPDDANILLKGLCNDAAKDFVNRINRETIRLDQIGLDFTKEEALERLKEIYNIK